MLEKRCEIDATDKLLLLDTVGPEPGAALVEDGRVVASAALPGRSASAVVVAELRRMLVEVGWAMRDLRGVGVVAGPGSFTGVRTGLATAKGLCEAAQLPMASVSRLALLMDKAGVDRGFAVLDAGRGSLYVRELRADGSWQEFLSSMEEMERRAAGCTVVVAEEKVAAALAGLEPQVHRLRAEDMLTRVRRGLQDGGTDVALADANYVLQESEIYRRPRARMQDEVATRSCPS